MSDKVTTFPEFSRAEVDVVLCALLTYLGQCHNLDTQQANTILLQIQEGLDRFGIKCERFSCWNDYLLFTKNVTDKMHQLAGRMAQ